MDRYTLRTCESSAWSDWSLGQGQIHENNAIVVIQENVSTADIVMHDGYFMRVLESKD